MALHLMAAKKSRGQTQLVEDALSEARAVAIELYICNTKAGDVLVQYNNYNHPKELILNMTAAAFSIILIRTGYCGKIS